MKYLILLAFIFSGCETLEKVETQEPTQLEDQNYKWKTQSQIDWTKTAIREHMSEALEMNPKDYKNFCPAWTKLNREERVQALTGLMAAMAVKESGVNGSVKFQEDFKDRKGKYIISRGLLQLSPESANQRAYSCNVKSDGFDLHNDQKNIDCATRILGFWIDRDGVISGYWDGKWRGGARYWSVLRKRSSSTSLAYIKKTTKNLKVCK